MYTFFTICYKKPSSECQCRRASGTVESDSSLSVISRYLIRGVALITARCKYFGCLWVKAKEPQIDFIHIYILY